MDWLASPHGHIATNIVEYPLLLMLSVGEREGEGDGEDIFGLHDETRQNVNQPSFNSPIVCRPYRLMAADGLLHVAKLHLTGLS